MIRPLLDKLSPSFQRTYKPTREQAVNESKVKFKECIDFKQYMPMKPIKQGDKIWVREDTHSFVCDFQVYTGKLADTTKFGLGEQVAMDLMTGLEGKNYHIYFDNFFSSVNLMEKMKSKKVYCCGTVCENHKSLPKLKAGKELRQERREVIQINRKEKDGPVAQVICPNVIVEYDNFMGCINKADMLKSIYAITKKSRKWRYHLLWHFVNITTVIAFVLFKLSTIPDANKMTLKDFECHIVTGLVVSYLCKGERHQPFRKLEVIPKFKPYVPPEKKLDQSKLLTCSQYFKKMCSM
ncbi:hypothetical protein QYM36_016860 [Artemia franciscana]|uniref:PiggyBac transposable element-derived protein domain-containing protein n=1 Tax=Artemia franciscana TaxID=6661 RepID=A0AA88H4D4_ARTSF|nr:hypothetical protein QYM36_016860 [Artemia franciscana]